MPETQLTDLFDDSRMGDKDFAAMAKALGHPARIRIIKYLLKVDRCICGGIVDQLPLAQSTVSQHLKILKQSGLIQGEVEGPSVCYCVDRAALSAFARAVAELGAI